MRKQKNKPNPVARSPLAFLPVMLAAWQVLCRASTPLGLTTIMAKLTEDMHWLSGGLPTRLALENALDALAALGVVQQAGMQYSLVPVQESFNTKNQEELINNNNNSYYYYSGKSSPAKKNSPEAPAPKTARKLTPKRTDLPDDPASETLAALKQAGVLASIRRELVQKDPTLTPADVRDLEAHLKQQAPASYSPGLLVYWLRLSERAPAAAPAQGGSWMTPATRALLTCEICGEINCSCDWDRYHAVEPAETEASDAPR